MTTSESMWWLDDLTEVCVQFQLDLSCLVDGELDEMAAGRAIEHLEGCSVCSDFFDDTRSQLRALQNLSNTDALLGQYHTLLGSDLDDELEAIDLVHKLSHIFYQLGKAYLLSAVDADFRVRFFEKAIQIGGFQTKSRGFVDGVLSSGSCVEGTRGGTDWQDARHLLNGKLEKIVDPLEKGRRLLKEALNLNPENEEARFYVSWADMHDGKAIRAAQGFRQLFRQAQDPVNQAHAAMNLGVLHELQGDWRSAVSCFRWVTMSGMAEKDDRFFVARFNLGLNYAFLRDQRRSLAAFRKLLDLHGEKIEDIRESFSRSEATREVISSQPGFTEALFETCPELFQTSESTSCSEEDVQ